MAGESEFGGEGVQQNTIYRHPAIKLSAEERRRLLMLTGQEKNPEAEHDPAWFNGEKP